MGLNVIPLSDSYADYAYTAISILEGKTLMYEGYAGVLNIEAISQWPLLHTLTIETVRIVGLDLISSVSYLVPTIIWLSSTIFVYIIIRSLLTRLGFGYGLSLIVTLLYVMLPHIIYETMQFIRGTFGVLWISFFLYLIIRSFHQRRHFKSDIVIQIIVSTCLAVSHHYSALLFLIFLLAICFGIRLRKGLSWIRTLPMNDFCEKNPFRTSLSIHSVMLFVWWLSYAILGFEFSNWLFKFFRPLAEGYVRQLRKSGSFEVLRPFNITMMILVRDFILYGSIALGILYFLIRIARRFMRKGIRKEEGVILAFFFGFCSVYFLAALFVGRPDKVITWFAPVLVVFSAFCFHKLLEGKILLKAMLLIALTVAGIGASLAPYSHNYAPIYLYNDSVQPHYTKGHNPNYVKIANFLETYTSENYESYVSDDGRLLYTILPPREMKRIASFGLEEYKNVGKDSLMVRFGNYDPETYKKIESNANKIYSSILPDLWTKR
jgi:hypothetical protein